jgi:hypothetical protein
MKTYLVYWIDAGLKMGWQAEGIIDEWAEDFGNFLCTTVGLVQHEDDEYLVIIQGTTKGSVLNPIRIRRDNIVGIQELINGDKETESD